MEHKGGCCTIVWVIKPKINFTIALDRSWLMIYFTTINQKQMGTDEEERRERTCKWEGASMGRLSIYDCFGFWGQLE